MTNMPKEQTTEPVHLTLELALIRWSVVCQRWTPSSPQLDAFLAGWFCRSIDLAFPEAPGRNKNSFMAGWTEASQQIHIQEVAESSDRSTNSLLILELKAIAEWAEGHDYGIPNYKLMESLCVKLPNQIRYILDQIDEPPNDVADFKDAIALAQYKERSVLVFEPQGQFVDLFPDHFKVHPSVDNNVTTSIAHRDELTNVWPLPEKEALFAQHFEPKQDNAEKMDS